MLKRKLQKKNNLEKNYLQANVNVINLNVFMGVCINFNMCFRGLPIHKDWSQFH